MANTVSYINTGSTTGGDGTTNKTNGDSDRAYANFNDWEVAQDGISYSPGETHDVYVTGVEATANRLLFNGWDADVTVTIRGATVANGGADSQCHGKPEGAGINSSHGNQTILIYRQLNLTQVYFNGAYTLYTLGGFADSVWDGICVDSISGCRIIPVDGKVLTINNSNFIDAVSASIDAFTGLSSGETFVIKLNNCGFNGRLVVRDYASMELQNCWISSLDAFVKSGTGMTIAAGNCAFKQSGVIAADLDTDNGGSADGVDFTNYFVDFAGFDWNLTTDAAELIGAGDNTLTGVTANDANGVTRDAACEIGAYEYDAGGAILVVQSVSLALTIDAAPITQANEIAPADLGMDVGIESPAISSGAELSAADLAMALAMESPAILQANAIAAASMGLALGIDAAAIAQANELATAELSLAIALAAPSIAQANSITPSEIAIALSVGNVTIASGTPITAAGIGLSLAIEVPVISQAHGLAPDSLSMLLAFDAAALVQAHELVAQGITLGLEVGNIDLSQGYSLSVDALALALGVSSTSLAQANEITVAAISLPLSIDSPVIAQASSLTVEGLSLALLLESAAIGDPILAELEGRFSILSVIGGRLSVKPVHEGRAAVKSPHAGRFET
ncbi:MAG: hypothetical protein COA78_07045 [Blastopirellula sp.]|nr:MAG: hypothetical protein COA78_07045 [Blastopirellula sp.]